MHEDIDEHFDALERDAAKLTTAQRRHLMELRRVLTMESAEFGEIGVTAGHDLPKTEREVTPFIRERTRNWRASWCLAQIDALLGVSS